jgi:hypothetical protein
MFFGILTAQVCKCCSGIVSLPVLNNVLSDLYYSAFPNDRIILKIAVVWVYLAGVAQTGLVLLDFNAMFMQMLQASHGTPDVTVTVTPDHFWLSIAALTGAGAA